MEREPFKITVNYVVVRFLSSLAQSALEHPLGRSPAQSGRYSKNGRMADCCWMEMVIGQHLTRSAINLTNWFPLYGDCAFTWTINRRINLRVNTQDIL